MPSQTKTGIWNISIFFFFSSSLPCWQRRGQCLVGLLQVHVKIYNHKIHMAITMLSIISESIALRLQRKVFEIGYFLPCGWLWIHFQVSVIVILSNELSIPILHRRKAQNFSMNVKSRFVCSVFDKATKAKAGFFLTV